MSGRWWIAAAVALWLGLQLPRLGVRYSYDWDASQFARGAFDFDMARHQPHPPGYPLWEGAVRLAAPLTGGNAARAQVVLSLLFTAAALWAFRRMSGCSGATIVLAFSPVVAMYAGAQSTYPVDLLASCLLGWLAWRVWHGEAGLAVPMCAAAGLVAGFRQSGVMLMAPLLAAALWRVRWRRAMVAVAAGAASGLFWFVPLVASVGSLASYRALTGAVFAQNVRPTTVVFGAGWGAQWGNSSAAVMWLGSALCGIVVAAVVGRRRADPMDWRFLALWAVPELLFITVVHCPKAGYVMLALPPLAVWASRWIDARGAAAGVAAALLVSYLPWEQIHALPFPGAVANVVRFTPRVTWMAEADNRELARLLEQVDPQTPVLCLRRDNEGPNWRTASWDFPARPWVLGAGAQRGRVAVLANAEGPPAGLGRFERLGGNARFSLWLGERD